MVLIGGPNGSAGVLGGNDFSVSATQTFSSDTLVRGSFGVAGDEDGFRVTNNGAALRRVHVEVTEDAAGLVCGVADTLMEIRDLGGMTQLARSDDEGVGNCSMLDVDVPAGGTVFVHLWDYSDNDPLMTYFLRIVFL